jgi:RNA polymerase sigma-70 factor (ECF subfamily)
MRTPPRPAEAATRERHARVRALVDEHVRFVARTLLNAGVPQSDVDDEVQRTFMVVSSRLADVKQGAERSFLFQVAINMAAHARRKLARRREILSDHLPERIEAMATPERLTERKQTRRLLDGVVGSMSESVREVFMLYELEGMDRREISTRLGLPRGTVASRLRRARAQFRQNVTAIELAWDAGAEAARGFEQPAPLRREGLSARAAVHAHTLDALGLG